MKKILKRLLISTALITPIAISTPLLLTSCSADVEIDKPVVETGPSIFKESYGPIELFAGNENSPKGYYLDATIKNDEINNEVFQTILNIIPTSPKFIDLANPTATALNLGLTEVQSPKLPTGLENKVNYSEFEAKNQELSSEGKSAAILKILKNFIFESTNNADELISLYPSSAFDLEKFKNDITYDVNYTVRQGTIGTSTEVSKYFVVSDVSFTFKLKDNTKKWAGLKSGDPIFVTIKWTEESKSTLFKKGFTLTPDTTGNVINFTGTLDKAVFGDNATSIDKTEKIKQWFEGATDLNGGANGSYGTSNLTAANGKIGEKLSIIFQNISGELTNPGANSQAKQQPVKFTKENLTTNFIKGIAQTTTPGLKVAPTGLGIANITPSIQKISKVGNNDAEKKFSIELQFDLVNDNEPGWYGLIGTTSKMPIKFTLEVTTK